MARNIEQVYTDNPSTTLANDDLVYAGKSPYGATDDSAIKYSDLSTQILPNVIAPASFNLTNLTVDAKGRITAATSSTLTAGNAIDIDIVAPNEYVFSVTGGGLNWRAVNTPGDKTLAPSEGLISNTGAATNYVFDATPGTYPVGSVMAVSGGTAPGWTITVPAGVTIEIGNITYTGATVISSNSVNDVLFLLNVVADTNFIGFSSNTAALISAGYLSPVNYSPATPSVTSHLEAIDSALTPSAHDLNWVELTGSPGTTTLVNNVGYICNTTATTEFLTPAAATIDFISAIRSGTSPGWKLSNRTGQNIQLGNISTGSGASSYIESTDKSDQIIVSCNEENVNFYINNTQGNPNLESQLTTSDLTGLIAWYKADDINNGGAQPANSTALSSWLDTSGNTHDLSQGTGANQPVFFTRVFNGLPGVLFDGINDSMLNATATNATDDFYLFFVATPVTFAAVCHGWVSVYNNSSGTDWNDVRSQATSSCASGTIDSTRPFQGTVLSNIVFDRPFVYGLIIDGSNVYAKGSPNAAASDSATGNYNQDRIVVGARFTTGSINTFGNEYFHEIIIGNATLTQSQQRKIIAYLSNKWGVPYAY